MFNNPETTNPYPEQMARQIKMSHEGMAHWAGTGPAGKMCSDCRYMKIASEKSKKGTCEKFRVMMGLARGKYFPVSTAACRFYEQHAHPND